MAYPKAQRRRAGRPSRPVPAVLPRRSSRTCSPTGRRRHLPGQRRRARPAGDERRQRVRLLRRPAVRQRPAALRPPADRLRQGRRAALPDHARPPGRAPLRLGLPRPARRVRGREAARHQAQGRDRGDGRRAVQRRLPRPRCCATPTSGSDYVTRQARWVDFDNDYKTLDLDYMESVMWAFKTLWDKGLIYEGFRVLWYCWRCETPLSNTETKMDDVYRDRQDPAVTVGLRLRRTSRSWTASGAGLDDDAVDAAVEPRRSPCTPTSTTSWSRRRAASATCSPRPAWPRTRASWARTPRGRGRVHGRGAASARRYTPPFDFFVGTQPNAHQVLAADYVTTEDGTGIVHIAPAFGEEDKAVTDAAGIEPVTPVDSQRRVRRAGAAVRGHARLRRQQADHHGPQGGRARCCGTRPTTTRTRTAGAATTR